MTSALRSHIVSYLLDEYDAHTIILYGSNTELKSGHDVDLLVLSDRVEAETRDWSIVEGLELDAFIAKSWNANDPRSLIRLRNGILLLDQIGQGSACIQAAQDAFRAGVPQQSPQDFEFKKNWVTKTLKRLTDHDLKSVIRRNEAFSLLLQQYFQNKGWWYEGSKIASQKMQSEDREAYEIFLSGDLHRMARLVFGHPSQPI